ncbi:MAG TPA: hypothetical protein VMI56_24260 [Reyranella sp.]|nr:hypothetical protein [Reyranella sp.]
MTKPRLAIVSTYDAHCGIAGYTRALVKQIEDDFDIEIFDLNQLFMRATNPGLSAAADAMVKEFCARAATFDCVNIQFEFGTFGSRPQDILRRFRWIVDAAPALSVTFHTVLQRAPFRHEDFFNHLKRFWVGDAWKVLTDYRADSRLFDGVHRSLRAASRKKTVNVIAHTQRDAQILRHGQRLPNVYDHPLVFLKPAEAAQLRSRSSRADFPLMEGLPSDAKIIGTFGFLSKYKGFETTVRTLRFLPEDYHLVIFGSVHPNDIRKYQEINPYIRQLLDIADVDSSIADVVRGNLHVNITLPEDKQREAIVNPNSLAGRIHFLGAQTDEDFARAMCLCDAVVMPYLEVGQSASGAISIALDVGARIIAAHNAAFLQFARYFPNSIEMFDIGNHIELAERLQARPAFPPQTRSRAYDTETNRAMYREANTARGRG